MSGIAAVFDRTGAGPDPDRLHQMVTAMEHRGPDGGGEWSNDIVGIGHQQLVTTPQGTVDDQPYTHDGLAVASDARLDNRPELLRRLGLTDVSRTVPDSQLLLEAYREWGDACVNELIGAFAFVVWDSAKKTLFCTRDHLGVKPLYYHITDDVFAVASEPKSLLTLPGVTPSLDESRVGDFLLGRLEDKTNSFYESVRRLAPAHATAVSAETDRMWQYWDLDPTRTITLESDEAYATRFRELFEQAVACRLRTDSSTATSLSGGLDSSSITAVARDILPADTTLATYSGVSDESSASDEREYIQTLVERDGIDSHYVFLDDLSAVDHIDEAIQYHDEPIKNTMHFLKWTLAKRASQDGIGVILEGSHGDSAVDYGLGLLPQLVRTGRWRHLYRELDAMGDVLDRRPRGIFVGQVLPNLVPRRAKDLVRRLRGKPTGTQRLNPTLDRSFVNRTGLRERYRRLNDEGSVLKRSARRWQYRSLMSGGMTEFFEANDVTHAAFGMEPRYPFTDIRLIEFSLAIPPTQQLRNGWTRLIIRRALEDVLPDKIRCRPWKTMMNQAFAHALSAADSEVQALVEDPGILRPYIDPQALSEVYERFNDDPHPRDPNTLWVAFSLASWLDEQNVAR
ncbi:asparagine synthase (glutamine-hydrolyzing) [Halorubrum ezzemoulense]|uniref:asparagine synthase (glutamine-hydrolyzing) n=1 Tax=Halorubrum ezzemoulense TaxID=337243 RepID=UPI00232DACE4|nr:asparagine synthase (glutamine-hydrolyzing) [Halorubrum ezzemoulense]MDB2262062.1 asparagine synthase (glutamine-hydrolyzing) [Halorubrum ezzemoulense]MDB2268909.1 asparagine synthase (glutamine-hydrolyzing) [Halorubrum ezzemoulense]